MWGRGAHSKTMTSYKLRISPFHGMFLYGLLLVTSLVNPLGKKCCGSVQSSTEQLLPP
ncbi:hypothetical protein OROGR_000359 [Orobanche gracilis]